MKITAVALTVILLLFFAASFVAQFSGIVSANMFPVPPINYVYIRADGSIEPSTTPITIKNNVYTLTGDFTNTTIIVERDGIILDGAGYSIKGLGTYYHRGVDISNRTNSTIKNLEINQFGMGIMMRHASKNTLRENNITATTAFFMIKADDNVIAANTVTNDQGYAIYGNGSRNQIIDNHFLEGGTGMGIYLYWSSNNNTISRNTITKRIGINLGDSQYNIISNNTIIGGDKEMGSAGILLARSSTNQVFGNTVKGKVSEESQALYISHDSFNNLIFENTFENNTLGVALGAQVVDTLWNNIYNNTLYRNNFLNNTKDVWIAPNAPINYWDNGREGNFWGSYNGTDNNQDGIGDTPFVIGNNNIDHRPLIAPYGIKTNPSPAPAPEPTPIPEPTPTTIILASAMSIAALATGIVLLVYFKKPKYISEKKQAQTLQHP